MNESKFLELKLPSRDNTTDIADINVISENFEIIDEALESIVDDVLPEYQTKENINLNFDDDSTNEEQYPSVPAVVNFTNRKIDPLKIVNSESGNAIALKDSANDKLVNLKLFGKTTQNGTPTPDAPIELKSVGDSGSFEVCIYEKNLFDPTQLLKASRWSESNGVYSGTNGELHDAFGSDTNGFDMPPFKENTQYTISFYGACTGGGIGQIRVVYTDGTGDNIRASTETMTKYTLTTMVGKTISKILGTYATLGAQTFSLKEIQIEEGTQATPYEPCNKQSITFTDTLRGVGDIADEIDFARGVLIQRVGFVNVTTCNTGILTLSNGNKGIVVHLSNKKVKSRNALICSHAKEDKSWNPSFEEGTMYENDTNIVICCNSTETLDTFKSKYADAILQYELATPIETPISKTELNAYRQLHTNKPTTTILSEAEMLVDYVADPKNYIDNKIAELTALTLEG